MSTPKVNYSDAVLRAAKQIQGIGGKKNKIDTYYEYEQLGKLLADVQAGKLDKNTIEKDSLYVKGLQVEYEQKYLGEKNQETDKPKTEENKPVEAKKTEKTEPAKTNKNESTPPAKIPERHPKEQNHRPEETKPKETPAQPKEDKPVQSKNSRNQSNITRNGINVNGDNNTIVIDTHKAAEGAVKTGNIGAEAAEETGKSKKSSPEEMIKMSKEEYTAAFAEGEQVAKDLIGYTNTAEKQNAIRHIMKQSPAKIMGFISGFNENDTVMGIKYGQGGLLDQIDNENGWTKSEKQEVFDKIIDTTLQWAKALGFEQDSNYQGLSSMLKQVKNGKQIDTERADMLINELVSRGKAKSGI